MLPRKNAKVTVLLVLLLAAAIIPGCELADNELTENLLKTFLKMGCRSCLANAGPWDNTLVVENQATAAIVQHQVRETRGRVESTINGELTQYNHSLPSGTFEVIATSATGQEWSTTVHFAGNNEVITLILTDEGYATRTAARTKAPPP